MSIELISFLNKVVRFVYGNVRYVLKHYQRLMLQNDQQTLRSLVTLPVKMAYMTKTLK